MLLKDILLEFSQEVMDLRSLKIEADNLAQQKKAVMANTSDPLQKDKLAVIAFEERGLRLKMYLSKKMTNMQQNQQQPGGEQQPEQPQQGMV